jgi:hypothetical protein
MAQIFEISLNIVSDCASLVKYGLNLALGCLKFYDLASLRLEKGDLLIHTGDCLNRGDHMGRFDCNIKTHHVSFPFIQYTRGKWAIVSRQFFS